MEDFKETVIAFFLTVIIFLVLTLPAYISFQCGKYDIQKEAIAKGYACWKRVEYNNGREPEERFTWGKCIEEEKRGN